MADAAGPQNLLDSLEQPSAVLQHDAVELLALGLVDSAGLQRFQVQPDGCDRRFQFVGDGVNEGVLLLVAADFADQEKRIQHHAHNQQHQQEHAQDQQNPGAPGGKEPAYVEQDD